MIEGPLGRLAKLALCLGPLFLSGCFFNLDVASLTRTPPLVEKVVLGDDGPKIALVEVQGVILDVASRSSLGRRSPSLVARVREALDRAEEDDEVEAVLLRVYSPGGTVSASETIHHELLRFKERTGVPVVAYLQGLATSGGYYIAMAEDRVVAHPTMVTGSIGVIFSGLNFAGLFERFGVADQSFTSGAFKDSGSPFRPMRDDEREQLQGVVDGLYGRFIEVVEQGRPGLPSADVERLADGRIYTANQALASGLVDAVGHIEDVIDGIEKRIGAEESRLIVYQPEGQYRDNFYGRPGGPVQVDVNVLPFTPGDWPPGFYYLWPAALGSSPEAQ
jgi:protease-4